ncbi:hypothetical protein [Corynebacterium mayonis]|uniref:hypothetical protein n=1 Tax=Corynebacterium mayonis TaxID=3062461 RepID=UPI00313FE3E2
MSTLRSTTRVFLVVQFGLVVGYILSGFLSDDLPLRVWHSISIGLGVVAIVLSVAFISLLWRDSQGLGLLAVSLITACLLIAAGWVFGLIGWVEEFVANQALPIINIGILLTPIGLVVGALAATLFSKEVP